MTREVMVHACTEIRADVLARTFCGLEVRQKADRSGWVTASWKPVQVTRRSAEVTCGRCWRCMD